MSPFDALTLAGLLTAATVYVVGVWAAHRYGGRTRSSFTRWRLAAYALGMLTLAAALVSPLATVAQVRFAAHMTQHEMLMLLAAPLLVLGQPLLAMFWALPARSRTALSHRFRVSWLLRCWQLSTMPLVVFLVHGIVLWVWHVPILFEWALRNEWIHGVQHLMFVVTAGLFWWGMVQGRYGRAGYGVGMLYVFLTAVHSTLLGALLTVAPAPWYPSYRQSAHADHGAALADQQLAGLIMWVPSGVVFILVGLALFAAWLGEAERRARLGSVASARRT